MKYLIPTIKLVTTYCDISHSYIVALRTDDDIIGWLESDDALDIPELKQKLLDSLKNVEEVVEPL